MAVPSPPSKSETREAALARRRAYAASLNPDLRATLQADLAAIVLPHLAGAGVVAFYHALKDEIAPDALMAALPAGQRAVLPWFADRDSRMIWREAPARVPSPWGVLQPPPEAEALAPDVVLVPLVLADRRGTRIGHGKGHYDRALAHLRESGQVVRTIGLAFAMQVSDAPLPADPWDQPLDAIATPGEWIACG